MKKTYLILIVLLSLSAAGDALSQTREARLRMKGYINPLEVVSIDSSWTIDQALRTLSEMSKQHAGKIIVDLAKAKGTVGITIVNQHWRDALELILTQNGLSYEEETEFIKVVSAAEPQFTGANGEKVEPPPNLESRDVKISAVFFSTNLSKLQEYGISWNFFRSKKSDEPGINSYFSSGVGGADTTSPIPPTRGGSFERALTVISTPPSFTFANLDALVKFFGTNDLGEVVTSPEVVVRNGREGKIQVGKDIFITTRDIAGNTVNQPISTGTIIKVTPVVYTEDDTDFVHLQITIEQSDVAAGPAINRTSVETHALLYDGEETVIGGLYTTLDSKSRDGVPILKDLPWWFFGLRYLFGSESILKTKSELIILLKVELSKPIRGRIADRDMKENILDKKKKEYQQLYENKK